ncbi:MAG: insulinase family protein [Muribaculaceae bacterium]|nr:insulinase family protein [Muribaculaceae bacterium]
MDGTEQLTIGGDIRLAYTYAPGPTEYAGLTVNAGSRDELTPETHGLAHMVEHTIFKGTPRRSDAYILNRMEAVGGELNAFTTKEETTVYTAAPAGNHRRSAELIGELTAHACFPARKMQLEREVIADEIDSYLDSPAEAIYDSFDELLYGNNPLAHNILGSKESIAGISSEVCRDYLSRAFTRANSVYFYLGPERLDRVAATVERALADLPASGDMAPRIAPAGAPEFNVERCDERHQAHVLLGAPIGGLHDPERLVNALAVNILGGPGMNALLNLQLRERRGLVYTVDASTALYSDCGLMTIYFGCDAADVRRCLRLVSSTLRRFADRELTPRRLQAYKRQYLGQLTLTLDNKEQFAINSARAMLHGLPAPSPARTAERLEAITPSDLRRAAEKIATATARNLILL